jgi:hypothetical protein
VTCHSFIHSCIHSPPPPSSRNFNFARVPRRHTEAPCRPPLTPPRSATTTRGTTAPSCARTTTPSRVTAVERRARARKKHPSARDGEARRTRRARVLARRPSASRPVPRRGTIVREVRRRRRIITRRRRRTGRSIIERAGDRVLGIAIIRRRRRRRRRRMDTARTMRTMRTMGTTRATARTMGTGAWRLRLSRFRRSVARRRRRRPGTVARRPSRGRLEDRRDRRRMSRNSRPGTIARRPSRGRLEDRRDRRRMSRNPRARRRRRTRTMDTIRTSSPIYSSRGTTRAITRGAFRGEVSSDGVIRINNQSVVLT